MMVKRLKLKTTMKHSLLIALLFVSALGGQAATSPYAGEQARAIKALSADEISGYLAGRGMGLARPAELNGYPGPRHVLDSADELKLTPDQTEALTGVFQAMRAAALPLGENLVAKETELDRLFTGKLATAAAVLELTRDIGRLQGELRAVHLNAHLATVKILRPEQIAAYNHLRDYDTAATPAPAGQHRGSL
jgi:Spy/CpxP family protein refolding chaperone